MAPELLVEEIDRSTAFWQTLLGFEMVYQRPEEKFIYLERPEGAQVMLHQRCDHWETGEMQPPFGRGVMFQIEAADLPDIEAKLAAADWPLHTGPREIWRRLGDVEGGQREIFVQDPDGYLVMLFKNLGERPIST
ncbi:MAG: VOC family protein [Sneathiella sp.]|uniref:bleomycin resistance protein n=1 Tax=Sneathiella sp. TaxID=1964365 RepID=UPI003002BE1D